MTNLLLKKKETLADVFEDEAFYVNDRGSLFYTYKTYINNQARTENLRYCYVEIKHDSAKNESRMAHSFETEKELISALTSYSCRKISVEINQV